MATLIDCVQLALEETPRYEGAPLTAPYRISSGNVAYLPAQNARILPNPSFIDRSDEMRGIEGGVEQLVDGYEPEGSIAIRCYLNSLLWFLQTLGLVDTVTPGGAAVTDPNQTTATGVNALNSAVVNVGDTSAFPATGSFVMGGVATTYTGKTATSFTGAGNHAATVGGEVINGNVPAGAVKHVFTKRGGITAKTMQLILAYIDEGVFLKGQGFGTSNLTLNADGAMTADLMGLVVARVADPNITPVFDASSIPHVRRGDLTLTWMSGTGTTDDFSLAIANPLNRRRTLSLATPSLFPDVMEHADDRVRLTGSIPKTVLDPDDYDALVAGTTFTAKARWKTPKLIAATTYPYTVWIEMAKCQYTEGQPSPLSNARRFGMETLNFWAAWDDVAGYDFRITVVNAISAAQLETLV